VRRMFDRVGHSVIRLKRIRTGGLVLGDLAEGAFRYLTSAEVDGLKELALKTGFSGQEIKVRSQGSGVRSQKRAIGSQRAVNAGRDEPRIMNERGTKKPAHRGAQPDARPWRAVNTDKAERRPMGARGYGRPGIGTRSQRPADGRVRVPVMQDTSDGRRKNQVVRTSAPQQSFERPGPAASGNPRGDRTYSPASRSATSRPPMRTGIGSPASGAAMGKQEVRRKPDQRPWPSTRKSGPGSRGPSTSPGYGPRKEGSARPSTRSAMSRPARGTGAGRLSTGSAMRKPETGRKPAPRSWSGGGSSDSRRRGAGSEARSEGRRPSSGPRPNRSTHSGKGTGPRGNKPGPRGPGRGASNRGPRR
jgi:hypothetical protein